MKKYVLFCTVHNLKPCLFSSLLKYRKNENNKNHNGQKQPNKQGRN